MLKPYFWISAGAIACTLLAPNLTAAENDKATVKDEHGDIGLGKETATAHTQNPDAQWCPDAGLGLFIQRWDCHDRTPCVETHKARGCRPGGVPSQHSIIPEEHK